MKIDSQTMKYLSKVSNAVYDDLKTQFLYHSNKLEGSTFNLEQLNILVDENKIIGEHSVDDVQETINSLKLFDFVVETLEEPLTEKILLEFHALLKANTRDKEYGFAGVYKKIPNRLSGVDLEVAQPYEVPELICKLLNKKVSSLDDIVDFHQKFEAIHPFQDGNGRIGRFIILKQCIENNIDLVAIDDEFNKDYKGALYIAQVEKNIEPLVDIFKKCQEKLDRKLGKYQSSIEELASERKQQ